MLKYFLPPFIIIILGFLIRFVENCSSGCFIPFGIIIIGIGCLYLSISLLCFLYRNLKSGKDINIIHKKNLLILDWLLGILLIYHIIEYIYILYTGRSYVFMGYMSGYDLLLTLFRSTNIVYLPLLGAILGIRLYWGEKIHILYIPFALSILGLISIGYIPSIGGYDYMTIILPTGCYLSFIIGLIRFHF